MDSVYQNSRIILSTAASGENYSQNKGNHSHEQESKMEVDTAKWNKVLLTVLAVSLVFAVGGLCVVSMLYIRALTQLSAQTNTTTMVNELTANYSRVKEKLSFYEAFRDSNMTAFQGKRYFFSSAKLTWSSSRAFCASRGADLVTITSQSEQEFLQSKIDEWHWIGLNDLETEGRWVWVNNQTLNDTGVEFWYKRQSGKSEPDNWKVNDASGEHCAIVKNDIDSLNSWFDVSCKHKLKFICEKKL